MFSVIQLAAAVSVKSDTLKQKKSGFFGLSGTFSHIFLLEGNKRVYSDSYPESGFYDTIFINKVATFDSLSANSMKNTLRFDFTTDESGKFRLGGGVGIRNEILKYSQIIPTHDVVTLADTAKWKRNSNVLVGRLYNNIGDKFRWIATGELFLTGYRVGDFNLTGEISKSFDWKKGACSKFSCAVTACCSNTRVRSKCMVPLHESLRHVGCHSSRRPESLSGRKFVLIQSDFRRRPVGWLMEQYANSSRFVPCIPIFTGSGGLTAIICSGKLSISH